MKQHITDEQLLEIGYNKCVRTVIAKNKQDRFIKEYDLSGNKSQWEEHISEQFTISRMIEILIDYEPRIDVLSKDEFKVVLWKDTLISSDYTEYIERELCDALWEAVKYTMKADLIRRFICSISKTSKQKKRRNGTKH